MKARGAPTSLEIAQFDGRIPRNREITEDTVVPRKGSIKDVDHFIEARRKDLNALLADVMREGEEITFFITDYPANGMPGKGMLIIPLKVGAEMQGEWHNRVNQTLQQIADDAKCQFSVAFFFDTDEVPWSKQDPQRSVMMDTG